MISAKILWNSVISTYRAKFACCNIKNMYLDTPLDRFEYMKMPINLIPDEVIEFYNLQPHIKNGFIYMEIRKGMYGLPQAGILANKPVLKAWLAPHGYFEQQHTPGLFRHATRPIWFNLTVDDFGIKYVGEEHLQHLFTTLKQHYKIVEDTTGSLYCGITLEWDYKNRHVDLSHDMHTNNQADHSTALTHHTPSNMVKTTKLWTQSTKVHHLMRPGRNTFNKLSAASYIMHVPSTQPF